MRAVENKSGCAPFGLGVPVRHLCYRKAFALARSIPGIGRYTAIRLVLEPGENPGCFPSGKKIASFVGLVPGEHSTGDTTWKGLQIHPGCSWVAIHKDPVLPAKFMRVWRGTGSKKKGPDADRACIIPHAPYAVEVVR